MKCWILLPFSPGSCLCSCARLKPGKEETFSPRHGHVFFVFSTWSTSKRRQTMRGPGGKGQGKPCRGKGKGKGKGTELHQILTPSCDTSAASIRKHCIQKPRNFSKSLSRWKETTSAPRAPALPYSFLLLCLCHSQHELSALV